MCHDHFKLYGVCINVVVNVLLSPMSVLSTPPAVCDMSMRTVLKLCPLSVLL